MDFLVEHPMVEAMVRAETHMVLQGFKRSLHSTETDQSFYRTREGIIGSIAEAVGLLRRTWVRFEASEEGEGRTHLTITASTPDLEREVEQWAIRELGATRRLDRVS